MASAWQNTGSCGINGEADRREEQWSDVVIPASQEVEVTTLLQGQAPLRTTALYRAAGQGKQWVEMGRWGCQQAPEARRGMHEQNTGPAQPILNSILPSRLQHDLPAPLSPPASASTRTNSWAQLLRVRTQPHFLDWILAGRLPSQGLVLPHPSHVPVSHTGCTLWTLRLGSTGPDPVPASPILLRGRPISSQTPGCFMPQAAQARGHQAPGGLSGAQSGGRGSSA